MVAMVAAAEALILECPSAVLVQQHLMVVINEQIVD